MEEGRKGSKGEGAAAGYFLNGGKEEGRKGSKGESAAAGYLT
jgi:hypothetical protein